MPKKIKPGETVNGYTILEELNVGAMAIAYSAQSPKGDKVFFKQYKSPSVALPWYKGYVAYQKEIKKRIETPELKRFTVNIIDFFEAKWGPVTFFEVFEFVPKSAGRDMDEILKSIRSRPTSVAWEQRLILARVMVNGISKLHAQSIVHCDLKPPNIQLLDDPHSDAKFQPKVIDMDFSILADRPAPWHGHVGYVGSPNYYSPEHLRGEVPLLASDVFTCGLILHELLGDKHPYMSDDPKAYEEAALKYKAKPITLFGRMPFENDAEIVSILHQCLEPDPRRRPVAQDILLVLAGRKPSKPVASPASPLITSDIREPMPPPAPAPAASSPHRGQLKLVCPSGDLQFGVRATVGQRIVRKLGEDAKYWHEDQMVVEPRGVSWYVVPNVASQNETILNGKAVTGATMIKDGDILGVGKQSKGIVKLPLTVHVL